MKRLYPWDDWFARDVFVLRRGREYRCSPYSIGQQIRNAAARLGFRVRVEVDAYDRYTVTVLERPAHAPG
jgi:hypothetical protein